MNFSDIYLEKLGVGLPSRRVSNDEIIALGGLNIRSNTIEKIVGIQERRWVENGESASDMAVRAIRAASIGETDGALWVSTISPDYYTPNTASVVKAKLGWQNTKPAIDLNAACSGLIFAIENGIARLKAFDESEQVIVATEIRSPFINTSDRRTAFLFGDGACALLLTRKQKKPLARFLYVKTHSIAQSEVDIWIPSGGSARPITAESLAAKQNKIQMRDGTNILKKLHFALQNIFELDLRQQGLCFQDMDYLVLHQANTPLLMEIQKALNFKPERIVNTFATLGNTSSSSIGIALSELFTTKSLRQGERICCLTLGAGDHLGIIVLEVCHD